MKNNKKEKEYLAKLLKLAFELQLERGEIILTDEDLIRMGIPLPPDDMFERIMKQLKNS